MRDRLIASAAVVVVFPTPPFWLHMVMIKPSVGLLSIPFSGDTPYVRYWVECSPAFNSDSCRLPTSIHTMLRANRAGILVVNYLPMIRANVSRVFELTIVD